MSACNYYGSFCGDTGCPVHGQPAPEACELCGRAGDIDHGAEHMGAVEFPESICESCWRGGCGPQLPAALCKCGTRIEFERTAYRPRFSPPSTGWRCSCSGCVDGGYDDDGQGVRQVSGEGDSPWEALDDLAATYFDCEPAELLLKEGT